MTKVKTPKRLKGFNDFFGPEMRLREFVIDTFKSTYEKYGYEPLETPALEYSELVLGQSGAEAEKQYYRFRDNGDRDVMLRFEVMISMCRAVAENINNLAFPYKRYQIQRVWRAENVQRGRYREFTQCDADTIGSTSVTAEAEVIQMGLEVLSKLKFDNFRVRISNRKFLEGLAEYLDLPTEQFYGFVMSIDKLEKIGTEKVIAEMVEKRGVERKIAEQAIALIDPGQFTDSNYRDTVGTFQQTVGSTKVGAEALAELLEMLAYFEAVSIDPSQYTFDTSIARGLASYTGPVYEFEVIDGGVGSVGGGGRYDKAIAKYIGQEIPAAGDSFGIERLCDIMQDRGMWQDVYQADQVLLTMFSDELRAETIKLADRLRKSDVPVFMYPDVDKLGKQFKFADKKGLSSVLVYGPDEQKAEQVVLKDMATGDQTQLSFAEIVEKLKRG